MDNIANSLKKKKSYQRKVILEKTYAAGQIGQILEDVNLIR
jgi:hypothetical protein